MTKNQITRALRKGGMNMSAVSEVGRDQVEVFVADSRGRADASKIAKTARMAAGILGWSGGGYYTGCGAFVLQSRAVDMGEWGDPSSRWHY